MLNTRYCDHIIIKMILKMYNRIAHTTYWYNNTELQGKVYVSRT